MLTRQRELSTMATVSLTENEITTFGLFDILQISRHAQVENMRNVEGIWNGVFMCWSWILKYFRVLSENTGGRLNKKDGLTRYGNSHVKDKTS